MITKSFIKVVLLLAILSVPVLPAAAQTGSQGTTPINIPNDPSLVKQVVNPDGTINANGMTDLGMVSVPNTSYMPGIPGVGSLDATFHEYMTGSGALVLVPTVVTDIGLRYGGGLTTDNMPDGYYNPGTPVTIQLGANYSNGIQIHAGGGTVDLGAGSTLQMPGLELPASALGNYNNLLASDVWAQIASAVNTDISLLGLSWQDVLASGNPLDFYSYLGIGSTTVYIYTDCAMSLVGCPAAYTAAVAAKTQGVINVPAQCPAPTTSTGPIQISGRPGAGSGGKLAPEHPIVVGQDPQRRGVDIQARALIPPIIYRYYEAVPRTRTICVEDDDKGTFGTGCTPLDKPFRLVTQHYYECIANTQAYADQLASATVSLSLTQESRTWILTSLAEAYPGAHLLHPDFSFSVPGPGADNGGTVVWSHIFRSIPVEDPGNWTVTVSVTTTGTPVSGSRFATQGLGTFLDELVRVTLVSGLGGIQP